jgi:flagellin
MMPTNSINTNAQAAVALQAMNATGRELQASGAVIATGKKIASAKDNGAVWGIATNQKAEANALGPVMDSLSRARSAMDVALAAGEAGVDILTKMKTIAVAGMDTSLTQKERMSMHGDYDTLRNQFAALTQNAEFDGINFLIGTGTTSFLADTSGQTLDVVHQNMDYTPFTPGPVNQLRGWSVDRENMRDEVLREISGTLEAVTAALANLGTTAQQIDAQITLNSKIKDTLEVGVGNLTDGDLAKESAKYQALQTRQGLAAKALAIANAAPQWIANLFRS